MRKYLIFFGSLVCVGFAAKVLTAEVGAQKAREATMNSLGPAPELEGASWLNTDRPLSIGGRKGSVTLIDFWTLGCDNCWANLDYYEKWQKEFSPQGFTIIGVHTPEAPVGKDKKKLQEFIRKRGITYPVLQDNDYKNWDKWDQEYWPTIYLVDKKGVIREKWVGEIQKSGPKLESDIARLVAEN